MYNITKLVSGIYRGYTEENKGKCTRSLSLSAAYTWDLQRRTRPNVQDHLACQRQIPGIYRGEQDQVYNITKLVSGKYRESTVALIGDKEGRLLTTLTGQEARWAEQ